MSLLLLVLPGCAPAFHEAPPTAAVVLYGTLSASAGADLATTIHFHAKCPSCYEGNLMMRPFVEMGTPVMVGVTAVGVAAIVTIGEVLRRHPQTQDGWWVVPLLATLGHVVATWQNLRLPY